MVRVVMVVQDTHCNSLARTSYSLTSTERGTRKGPGQHARKLSRAHAAGTIDPLWWHSPGPDPLKKSSWDEELNGEQPSPAYHDSTDLNEVMGERRQTKLVAEAHNERLEGGNESTLRLGGGQGHCVDRQLSSGVGGELGAVQSEDGADGPRHLQGSSGGARGH